MPARFAAFANGLAIHADDYDDTQLAVAKDRVYGLLPLSHVYGLASVCLGTLFSGASLHPQARFAPPAMAAFVTSHALTVCQGVPAMYAKLLEFLRGQGVLLR